MVMVLQHPCALRRGVNLHPKLLAASVAPSILRSKWSKAPFSTMPLPKLLDGKDYSADFVDLEVIASRELPAHPRIAVLSQLGVNLLMQRWVYHSTRLVVPTQRYSDTTVGPFDEADLIEEWIEDRVDHGADPVEAERECASWLDVKANDRIRRALLTDPQHASSVRREARAHRRSVEPGTGKPA
ncbi:MAG TPA: hypothetical protein VF299_10270 [Mycobacterium sp.]